jgi:hypothetical protein
MVNKLTKLILFIPVILVALSMSVSSVSASPFVYSNDTFTYVIPSSWSASPGGTLSSGNYTMSSFSNNNYMNRTIIMPDGYTGTVHISIDIYAYEQRVTNNVISLSVKVINSSGTYELWGDYQTLWASHTYTFNPPKTYEFPYDPTLCVFQLHYYYQETPNVVKFSVDNCVISFDGNPTVIENSDFTATADGWTGGSVSSGIYTTTQSTATTHTVTKQLSLAGTFPTGQDYPLVVYLQVIGTSTTSTTRTWETAVSIVNSSGTYKVFNHTVTAAKITTDDYVSFWVYYDPLGTNITITQTANGAINGQSVGLDNFHYAMVLPSYYYNVTIYNEDTMAKFTKSGTLLYMTSLTGGSINYQLLSITTYQEDGGGWFLWFTPSQPEGLFIRVYNSSNTASYYERKIFVDSPVANVSFVLTNTVNMVIGITFTIYDVSNYWIASSNITGKATQIINGITYTIDEAQLDITQNLLLYLTYGQYYYLSLSNPITNYTYTYGIFYATSSSIVLVISQSPFAGGSPADICTWNVTNADNLLNITADFGGAVSPEIKIYNESLLLEATYTFTGVEYVSISYPGDSNQSYSVKLTIPEYGWIQSRIAAANPASGFIVGFPLLASLDATTVMLAFITAISFVWTPKYKGMGAVITVGLAGLFVYLRWIIIPITIITLWLVLALIYALEHREGEDQ